MSARRHLKDPRTVAREIPGLFDLLFPQLVPGLVVHLNREIQPLWGRKPVPSELLQQCSLNHSLLFEIAYVIAETNLSGRSLSWDESVALAVERQRRYFDAVVPKQSTRWDQDTANWVAENLLLALRYIEKKAQTNVLVAPPINGFGWIANGQGDYAIDKILIEAKCTGKRFSSADYRQVLIYWLLSYSSAVENRGEEWKTFILINPRLALCIELNFDDVVMLVAAERSKVEILELFNSLIGEDYKVGHFLGK